MHDRFQNVLGPCLLRRVSACCFEPPGRQHGVRVKRKTYSHLAHLVSLQTEATRGRAMLQSPDANEKASAAEGA
jgi:hypothetical protein